MKISYCNPVWNGYLADPFCLRVEDADGLWFYAYGTGSSLGDAPSNDADEPNERAFPVLRSRDLVNWEFLGGALEILPQFRGSAHWAPEVAQRDGKFWMYYSAQVPPVSGAAPVENVNGSGDETHRLRVAVSDAPQGPFRDCGVFLLPGEGFSIDAHPFCDPQSGEWFLFFAKDFLDGRVGTGTAVVRLGDDMQSVEGEIQTVIRASSDWHIYERNRPLYGQHFDAWHTVEGAFVLFHEGLYYCLYSGGAWQTPGYGVSYGVASHPLGPWRDEWSAQGPSVLRGVPNHVIGPGHCSAVLGPDNATLWCVYHAWDLEQTARRMCIDPITWEDGPHGMRPRVVGPTWETQS